MSTYLAYRCGGDQDIYASNIIEAAFVVDNFLLLYTPRKIAKFITRFGAGFIYGFMRFWLVLYYAEFAPAGKVIWVVLLWIAI